MPSTMVNSTASAKKLSVFHTATAVIVIGTKALTGTGAFLSLANCHLVLRLYDSRQCCGRISVYVRLEVSK